MENCGRARGTLRSTISTSPAANWAFRKNNRPAGDFRHKSAMDIVLRGVQPEEITLHRTAANPAAGQGAPSVDALFREHYARMVSMLTRLTGDRAHAEEVAADVFHKLSQRPELLAGQDDL